MSICIAITTSEGLILATDSASTIYSEKGLLKVSPNARKLCQLKDYPIGTINWGKGNIKARTIANIIDEFSRTNLISLADINGQNLQVRQKSEELLQFISNVASIEPSENIKNLGIAVGGYSGKELFPELYQLDFENLQVIPLKLPSNFGINWFGATDILIRLLKGFSPSFIKELTNTLKVSPEQIQSFIGKFDLPIPWELLPLQEAINCSAWLLKTVIGAYKFQLGAPICDEPIRVAVITKEEGFKWIKREKLEFPPA